MAPARSCFTLTRPGARRRPEIAAVCDWLQAEAKAYAERYPFTRIGRGVDDTPLLEASLTE